MAVEKVCDASDDTHRWLMRDKLHVQTAAYLALLLSIVISAFVMLVILWSTVAGVVDWVFVAITAAFAIVSLLAAVANCASVPRLIWPYIALTLALVCALLLVSFFATIMSVMNPVFWQRSLRRLFWHLQDPTKTNIANDTMWLAVTFAASAFMLMCVFTAFAWILDRARVFMFIRNRQRKVNDSSAAARNNANTFLPPNPEKRCEDADAARPSDPTTNDAQLNRGRHTNCDEKKVANKHRPNGESNTNASAPPTPAQRQQQQKC